MAKKYKYKKMNGFLKAGLIIIGVSGLFCLGVLIAGSCTGQSFVEVLKTMVSVFKK